jgi:hypothetical protein
MRVTKIANPILDCGHLPTLGAGPGTGYGYDAEGRKYCYECCARRDEEAMLANGEAWLYVTAELTRERRLYAAGHCTVSNWPGSLKFKGGYSKGRHNISGVRLDVHFQDRNGDWWCGRLCSQHSQLARFRRMKRKPRWASS